MVNLNFLTILRLFLNNRFHFKKILYALKSVLSWFELHWTYISRENTWSIFARANNQIPMFAGRINRFPSKRLFSPWKAFKSWVELHWTGTISRENSLFKKVPKMAKLRQKLTGLTLTFWRFWTIFVIFFTDSSEKRFLRPWKSFFYLRFELHWTYISRRKWTMKYIRPGKWARFRQKVMSLTITFWRFWTIFVIPSKRWKKVL